MNNSPFFSVDAFNQREPRSFAAVNKHYFRQLFYLGKGITKDKWATEDIIQDLFVELWANGKAFGTLEDLKFYLLRAVANASIHYIRQEHGNRPDGRGDESLDGRWDERRKEQLDDRKNEGLDGALNERLDESLDEGLDERKNMRRDDRLNKGPEESLNERPDDSLNGRGDESLNVRGDESLNERFDDRKNMRPDDRLNKGPEESLNERPDESLKGRGDESLNERLNDRKNEGLMVDENGKIQPGVAGQLSRREMIGLMRAAMDLLPGRCGEVMRRLYAEDKTPQEVADEMGISVITVDSHCKHALECMRERFPRGQWKDEYVMMLPCVFLLGYSMN